MGSSKKQTIGYWYHIVYHAGIGIGPIDAFLEFRGGDKPAWQGELTSSGTITINAPHLWGGEKDQGGIVGDVDVMFGEETQQPNAFLAGVFGPQQPAWRGMTTLVFKGGRYGAMNPYPQRASYKIRKVLKGWHGDCWYPEKVRPGSSMSGEIAEGFRAVQWNLPCVEPGRVAGQACSVAGGDSDSFTLLGSGEDVYTVDVEVFGSVETKRYEGGVVQAHPSFVLGGAPSTTILPYHNVYKLVISNPPATFYLNHTGGTTSSRLELQGAPLRLTIAGDATVQLIADPVEGYQDAPSQWMRMDVIAVQGAAAAPVLGMNPAHIIYYGLTDPGMARQPRESINDASFIAAADWYDQQGFGLCTSYDPASESTEEFLQRICRVAGCSYSRSVMDGQWYLDVATGVYDIDSLPVLGDDDILEFSEQPTVLDAAVNSVAVKYFDPERKEAIVTTPAQAPALIAEFGTNHQALDFQEIPDARLANRVATRELLARITPTRAFALKTTRRPYSWRPGTYFRLQSPRRGIADMVCILGEMSSGQLRSGAISLTATQDIYGLPLAQLAQVEHGVDVSPEQVPTPIVSQRAMEAPYVELVRSLPRAVLDTLDDDSGFVMAIARDPATSRNYSMHVAHAGGDYAPVDDADWCPTALVVEADSTRAATAFTLLGGERLERVKAGSAALWGSEIVRIDAIDQAAGTITLGRGCADTVVATHAAGERIWFYEDAAAEDPTEYTAGETLQVKLLTNTGSQQLALSDAVALTLTMQARAWLPYPPGRVRIEGTAWPTEASGQLEIGWAHRARVAQADQLVDDSMGSTSLPTNQRYGLRFERASDGVLLVERTDIGADNATAVLAYTGNVRMRLWTIDDAGRSLQEHVHVFAYSTPSGVSEITAVAYTPYVPTWTIDGNGG